MNKIIIAGVISIALVECGIILYRSRWLRQELTFAKAELFQWKLANDDRQRQSALIRAATALLKFSSVLALFFMAPIAGLVCYGRKAGGGLIESTTLVWWVGFFGLVWLQVRKFLNR